MSTSLMPLDPAMSPQQVARLLPIRANLLPAEITDRRRARQMRTFVIAGVVLALVGLGGWSAAAFHQHSAAEDDLAAVNSQIAQVNSTMNDAKHSKVTKTIADNKAVSEELKTLMASDLRWSTVLDNLRTTAGNSNVTISRITAALSAPAGGSATGSSAASPVATLSLEGKAADKSTIANFIKKLQVMPGLGNPYMTAATQSVNETTHQSFYTFSINADVTSAALCGRFTTACKPGGK
jgi:iron uptake system EfeUOB component EfeO/EfeM